VSNVKTAIIIPDCHIPYENKKAYNLMLDVMKDIKPDEIVILGDYADFYAVSSHGRHPLLMHTLKEEVEAVVKRINELDKLFPTTKKYFLEGNHEYRLERYIQNMAPGLFGVTETEHILQLHNRPTRRFIPYGPNQSHHVLKSHLRARHEPVGSSARLTASRALCSLVYGHIHRIEESHAVGLDGTNHVAFSVGWLGDKNKDKVFGYVKNHHQWQLGFGVVRVNTSNRLFYHQKIHILESNAKYSCIVDGKMYQSK
jgi:UDP-2,3-diacylglucosamine pyrophosphatase LpxH